MEQLQLSRATAPGVITGIGNTNLDNVESAVRRSRMTPPRLRLQRNDWLDEELEQQVPQVSNPDFVP